MAAPAATNAASDLSPQISTLDNGLRILATPMPHTRSATVSFYVGAGSRYEADELAGVSHLVEHCVFKGSAARPKAVEISTAIEGVGGIINAATDRELTVYYAKAPALELETALDVVLDMVCRPRFEPSELEKERLVILEELAQVEDSPGQLAGLLLDSLLWRGTPAGRDIAGTPDSVRAIPYEATVNYWRGQYAPSNALVSVAGALDVEAVTEQIAKLTEHWSHAEPQPWRDAPIDAEGARVALRTKDAEQAHLILGLPALPSRHPDRYAFGLLASILGDGMSSRLFLKVREELGLVYDVHAYQSQLRDSGALQIYLGVDPENALDALQAALAELGRIREGVSEEELDRSRRFAAGRMMMGLEDTRAVSAWNGGQALMFGDVLSVDAVNAEFDAVTGDDIARLANEYIRSEELRLAVVGPMTDASPFEAALALD